MSTVTAPPAGEAPGTAERRSSVALASLLLLAGVLVAISPMLGVVRSADGSEITATVAAGFVAMLPGLLAVLLAVRRPVLGLAATAGAGVIGLVRLLTDLAVVTEADRITRPELFTETSERARPFGTGAGSWVLLAADLLWLAVGVIAAARLAPAVAGSLAPPTDDIFGPPAALPARPDAGPADPPDEGTVVGVALSRSPPGRRALNLPMIAVGFLGAVLLMIGALGIPYQGGYLALRVLPFGSSLTGLVAAALLGFLTAVVVVVAAAGPRAIAGALLAGTAVAAAVPSLTALAAVVGGAPTGLSPVVWCGLAGAAILASAALLTRRTGQRSDTDKSDGAPPPRWMTLGTGALALLSAAALLVAWRSPLLYLDGAAPDETTGGALLPAALPHLVAAVPLAVAGVLALLPPRAPAGRAALTVLWAGSVSAFGQALWVRSLVLSTAGNSGAGDPAGIEHSWTTAPGQWFSTLGTLLAMGAAGLAAMTDLRATQASFEVVDDDTLTAARTARTWPAVGLSVLVLVALAVPVYSDLTGSGPGLLHGYDLDTWAYWAVAIGALIGIWAATLTARRPSAVGWLVASAVVVAQPLVVPEAVRAVPGFGYGAGRWLVLVAVAALLVGAWWFGGQAGRVRRTASPSLVEVRGPAASTSAAGKDERRGVRPLPGRSSPDSRGATGRRSGNAPGSGGVPGTGPGRPAQPKGR